jgi:hypothetical protein
VPGVVAPLGTDNDVRVLREHVDDLAFALVAPLGAHQNCIRHKLLGRALTIKIPEV